MTRPHIQTGGIFSLLLAVLIATGAMGVRVPKPLRGTTRARISESEHAAVVDDPHFTTHDGVPFDFHGEVGKPFCLVSDAGVHLNALLDGYRDHRPFGDAAPDKDGNKVRTWMKDLGVLWRGPKGAKHALRLSARRGKSEARGAGFLENATLDGVALRVPYDGKPLEADGLFFAFDGVSFDEKKKQDNERFILGIADAVQLALTLRPANKQLQTPDDAEVHFNIGFDWSIVSPKVHGVMGQTFQPGRPARHHKFLEATHQEGQVVQADQASGKGFLDGTVQDYETSNILKPDCKFAVYKE